MTVTATVLLLQALLVLDTNHGILMAYHQVSMVLLDLAYYSHPPRLNMGDMDGTLPIIIYPFNLTIF
jgi:hypothetical protein